MLMCWSTQCGQFAGTHQKEEVEANSSPMEVLRLIAKMLSIPRISFVKSELFYKMQKRLEGLFDEEGNSG